MKVLVKELIAKLGIEVLREDFDVDVAPEMTFDELIEQIGQYDALIVRSATKVTKEVIDKADKLKVIGRAGIGVDNVDVEAATKRGIIVCNAPESNIVSAAEHAIALLMTQSRMIPQANASLKSGKWERGIFKGVELSNKTIGIVGLGKIGTLVAMRCRGLNMKVIAYDPYLTSERIKELGVEMVDLLDDLLRKSDFITIHLPKSKETLGMFGSKEIAKMKDGVRIVNAARGGVIDEKALADAVKSGKVASAGIDVFAQEPCTESPLFELDQVVVTPHLGASTLEAQDRAGIVIAEQVSAALKGEFASNAVNIPAISLEVVEVLKPFLPLCENLGKLYGSIAEGRIESLDVEYEGHVAQHDTKLLTIAAVKGLLEGFGEEGVNYVNAQVIAEERGLVVRDVKIPSARDYTNLVTLKGKDSRGEMIAGGTLIGPKNKPRFVKLYRHDIDIEPAKYMAFFRYEDVPGMIGKVGTLLGQEEINIATMQVGRRKVAGEAVMGVTLDSPISDDVLARIRDIDGFSEAKQIEL